MIKKIKLKIAAATLFLTGRSFYVKRKTPPAEDHCRRRVFREKYWRRIFIIR